MIKTVSLETAKKLKERGLEIDSEFNWICSVGGSYGDKPTNSRVRPSTYNYPNYPTYPEIPAPTICEILEVAPNRTTVEKRIDVNAYVATWSIKDSWGTNPAESLVLLLIKLHDENIINLKELK